MLSGWINCLSSKSRTTQVPLRLFSFCVQTKQMRHNTWIREFQRCWSAGLAFYPWQAELIAPSISSHTSPDTQTSSQHTNKSGINLHLDLSAIKKISAVTKYQTVPLKENCINIDWGKVRKVIFYIAFHFKQTHCALYRKACTNIQSRRARSHDITLISQHRFWHK